VPIGDVQARLCDLKQLEILLRFWRANSGASLIEYSLAASIMIAVMVVGIRLASNWISAAFSAFSP
jgi:Flp pilus assembly pilin Flp